MTELLLHVLSMIIPELVMAITVAGVVGWHVTHASIWWSRPLFQLPGRPPFSDRRHLWSWLSYWPICTYVVHGRVGWAWSAWVGWDQWSSWGPVCYWAGAGLASKLIWTMGKGLARKDWSWIGVQFVRSVRRG